MKKRFLLRGATACAAVMVLTAAFVAPAFADDTWATYINERFGYSVQYPEIFTEREEPDNGDGVWLKSDDGEYELTLSGGYNVLLEDPEGSPHRVVRSERGKKGKERVIHEYKILNEDAWASFILSYPKAEAKRFAEITKHMEASLKLPEGDGDSDEEGMRAPDAWMNGLWLKLTGLPEDALYEDFTQERNKPWFVYSFGKDEEEVTIGVGRVPQNAARRKKCLALDKTVLKDLIGPWLFENGGPEAFKLRFVEAPDFSEKFGCPCQFVTWTDADSVQEKGRLNLFIQTKEYMFRLQVSWVTSNKNFRESDAKALLEGLEMFEQVGVD